MNRLGLSHLKRRLYLAKVFCLIDLGRPPMEIGPGAQRNCLGCLGLVISIFDK